MAKAKKEKAMTKAKEKRELVFAGAAHLMGVDPKALRPSEIAAHKARNLVSKALGIPANTVVIMGNVPYVDNHGRKHKLAEYEPQAQFEYDYVQIATDDNMKAIVKCRIVKFNDKPDPTVAPGQTKPLCGWVIGECSPTTTRMQTLKGYQNQLAQTRAENRAFEAAFGTKFRTDLYEGVAKELGVKPEEAAQPEAELALQAGNTSAEEAVDMGQRRQAPVNFDPFKNALLAINQAKGAKALEALRARIKGSTHLKSEEVNKLFNLIDDRIAKA